MYWSNLLNQQPRDGIIFQLNLPPVSETDLQAGQFEMALVFPEDLLHLYRECDGLSEWLDGLPIGIFIWSWEQLLSENRAYRANTMMQDIYQPFDHILLFGTAGNGDLFGYMIEDQKVVDAGIYVWNHEDDSRTLVASDLSTFVQGWTNGTISI